MSLIEEFKALNQWRGIFGELAALYWAPTFWRLTRKYDAIIDGLIEGKLDADSGVASPALVK